MRAALVNNPPATPPSSAPSHPLTHALRGRAVRRNLGMRLSGNTSLSVPEKKRLRVLFGLPEGADGDGVSLPKSAFRTLVTKGKEFRKPLPPEAGSQPSAPASSAGGGKGGGKGRGRGGRGMGGGGRADGLGKGSGKGGGTGGVGVGSVWSEAAPPFESGVGTSGVQLLVIRTSETETMPGKVLRCPSPC